MSPLVDDDLVLYNIMLIRASGILFSAVQDIVFIPSYRSGSFGIKSHADQDKFDITQCCSSSSSMKSIDQDSVLRCICSAQF